MRSPEDAPTDPDQLIRFGRVASVDLAAARCVVTLDDGTDGEGAVQSPPLRWLESRMGAVRVWSPPSEGEQVLLLCPGGEIGAGVVMRGIACADYPPPATTAAPLIRFGDGAEISYDAEEHELTVILPAGASTTIASEGGIALTGDVTLTGKLTASVDVIAAGKSLKDHHHTGVQPGSGQTGAPA